LIISIVADSSDLDAIRKFRPLDATTNPSLITAAAEQPESKELIEDAYYQAKEEGYSNDESLRLMDGIYELHQGHYCRQQRSLMFLIGQVLYELKMLIIKPKKKAIATMS
jgi:hypothetical protein